MNPGFGSVQFGSTSKAVLFSNDLALKSDSAEVLRFIKSVESTLLMLFLALVDGDGLSTEH